MQCFYMELFNYLLHNELPKDSVTGNIWSYWCNVFIYFSFHFNFSFGCEINPSLDMLLLKEKLKSY